MAGQMIPLQEVDEARITLVMDNAIDVLMSSTPVAKRLPLGPNPFERPAPRAEHGFSALITVKQGDRVGKVMFDTGVSPDGILHNMDTLEIDAHDLHAVVLSHGHADHAMGLPGLVERLGIRNLPLVLHPDAYLERKLVLPNGFEVRLPAPRIRDLRQEYIEVIEEVGPSMLVDGMVLISGEVARTTDFETGFPIHYSLRNGTWEHDPLIHDDQCAIIKVKGKGLVVITGCGHSGIINILRNARRITGVEQIYAVVGGFHLSGPIFEPIIQPTVATLVEIGPAYVMPGHCTGWAAVHQIARSMPEAFIANSVGTTLIL